MWLSTVYKLKSTVPHLQNGIQLHISLPETFGARFILKLGLFWNLGSVCILH